MAKNFSVALNMILNSAEYTQSLKKVQGVTQDWASKITGAIAGAFALNSLYSFVKSAVQGYNDTAQANAKMNAVLLSTGGIAGVTGDAIKKMTSELSSKTLFSKSALTDAAAVLLTFTKIGKDAFPQVLKAATNMSTVLGTDLHASIIQLGKAMNSPATGMLALKKSGVSFTESQIALIKSLQDSGDLMGAQKVILAELKTEFDGAAEAAAKAGTGPIEMITKKFMSLKKAIGEAIVESSEFTKTLDIIANKMTDVVYVALNKNIDLLDRLRLALAILTPGDQAPKGTQAEMQYYKDLESLGLDNANIQKGAIKAISEYEKEERKAQYQDEVKNYDDKAWLLEKYANLKNLIDEIRPKKGGKDPEFETWHKRVELAQYYKELIDKITDSENAAKKPKATAEKSPDEIAAAIKAANDAFEAEKSQIEHNATKLLTTQTDLLREELITKERFDAVELEITKDKYLDEYFLLKKYGKDTTELELKIAQERLKIKNSVGLKPMDRRSGEYNTAHPDNTTSLIGMEYGGSAYNAQKNVEERIDTTATALSRLNQQKQTIESAMQNAIAEIGINLGTAFGKMLSGKDGAKAFEEFGASILQTIGKFLQQIGEALITYAVGMIAFKQALSNPYLAAIVGIALIAAGAAFTSLATAGPGASASYSGGSGGGGSNYATSPAGYGNSGSDELHRVVFEIQGNTLVGVLDNVNKRKNNFK